ncbi:MAG: hypothetical protein ACKO37_08250 [Vampirovibrionales bacterium]
MPAFSTSQPSLPSPYSVPHTEVTSTAWRILPQRHHHLHPEAFTALQQTLQRGDARLGTLTYCTLPKAHPIPSGSLHPLLEDTEWLKKFPMSQEPFASELCQLIPPWRRLLGTWNTQHNTHDFPLDLHTQYVIAGANEASQRLGLSPVEACMVRWGAWLHDIAKTGGLHTAKAQTPVDKHHPWKSAVMSQWLLCELGFTPLWIERLTRLVQFHQLLGAMIIRHAPWGKVPTPQEIRHAQWAVQHPLDLPLLQSLTEGDIRGVKAQGQLFDARVAYKLECFMAFIQDAFQYDTQTLMQHPHFTPSAYQWDMPHATLTPEAMGYLLTHEVSMLSPVPFKTLATEAHHGWWWLDGVQALRTLTWEDCHCGAPNAHHLGAVTGFGYQSVSQNGLGQPNASFDETTVPKRPHTSVQLASEKHLPACHADAPFWLWVTAGAENIVWQSVSEDTLETAWLAPYYAQVQETSHALRQAWHRSSLWRHLPETLRANMPAPTSEDTDVSAHPPWLGMTTAWWLEQTPLKCVDIQHPWVIGVGTTLMHLEEARSQWDALMAYRETQGLRNDRLRQLPWVLVETP